MKLTKEQKDEILAKKVKTIKAQNEMLEQAKEKIRNTDKIDEIEKSIRIEQIDDAINQNKEMAKNEYGVTEKDIENLNYNIVSPYYEKKYQERLKKYKLTDEKVRQKSINNEDSISYQTGDKETKKRRRSRKSDKNSNESSVKESINEEYKIDKKLEEELMKKSYMGKMDGKTQKYSDEKLENSGDKITENNVIELMKEENNDEPIKANYSFDFSSIPEYVQYDVIPLPSNGQCYKNKMSRIPVAYLTASDENIIASPNMYRDGKIIDVILSRKILDKSISVDELCQGDKDAITLWLRATGYGNRFPIVTKNPKTGKEYSIDFDLSKLKYFDFNLIGDENGYFDYTTSNGDKIKFKILSSKEEDKLKNTVLNERLGVNSYEAYKCVNALQICMNNFEELNKEDRETVSDCILDLKDIIGEHSSIQENKHEYEEAITEQMIAYTMSINGNDDKEYIKNYILNMRSGEAFAYRKYVINNKPGVNFKITVNVPESDGGGSFETFLSFDDTIFLNV